MQTKRQRTVQNIIFRILICAFILLGGIFGMQRLSKLKKPPVEVKHVEFPLQVEVIKVLPVEATVTLTGYGDVLSLQTVEVMSEVTGKVIKTHERLEIGEIIAKDEILFEIDSRDYRAAFNETQALTALWKNTIARLTKQYAMDQNRMKSILRNRDLAKIEYSRVKRLFNENKIGTRSGVDRAEQAFNAATDQADQISRAVALYPFQIAEAQNNLTMSVAKRERAQTAMERCVVRAPFDCRLKRVSVENGSYVTPGKPILVLSSDIEQEIHVALDRLDARDWLSFLPASPSKLPLLSSPPQLPGWFPPLVPVPCRIKWPATPSGKSFQGVLKRVVVYNQDTRMVTVAIRVQPRNINDAIHLPLVEGMFCRVEIPGRRLSQVFRVPRGAVSFDKTVFLAVNNRLKTVPVDIAHIEDDDVLIRSGIAPGDLVITTRLVDPLENTLLEYTQERKRSDSSSGALQK